MPTRPLAVLLMALVAVQAHAMSAEDYFADGNRLFRDDLYWAALLRYSQAQDAGLDTPLLHYNTGVAHYHAGQHIRARQSLLRAVNDPQLRIPTQYNLGLNAWALGETEEALGWFRLARDQQENDRLREFAVVAIARIRAASEVPTDYEMLVEDRRKKDRELTNLELRARIGFGQDDNVFRSPDRPYIDLSDPDLPVVTPVVQAGAFVPASLSARYSVNSLPFEGFYGAYRLAGRYFLDSELKNANEYIHELSFGAEYEREDEERNRERRVHSAFKVARNDEIYYDPDNGLERTIDGVPVDDRMNYLRYGPELSFRQSGERLSFGLNAKAQLWDYEETNVLPEYDHQYFLVSLYGQYKFAPTSLLRLTADFYSRRYSDRPAYDLDGDQGINNPAIRYDYLAIGLRARQRITDTMWFGFDIERTERTDQYVGYNNYTRDSFGLEFHWLAAARFDVELSGIYRIYDYPNAFAFHNPLAGNKTQESLDGSATVLYRLTRHFSVVAEARFREVVSNDIRIQYERLQYILGIRWEH